MVVGRAATVETQVPQVPELEDNLVGSVLSDNSIYERVASVISPEDFSDALLSDVWAEIGKTIKANRPARWQTIGQAFGDCDGRGRTVAQDLQSLTQYANPIHAE